jgi:hypothetical protein
MPVTPYELSVFFDRLYSDLRKEWDRMVDYGQMTDNIKGRRETRMDEIGAILRALGEGQAVLTYNQPAARNPSPPIFVLPRVDVED